MDKLVTGNTASFRPERVLVADRVRTILAGELGDHERRKLLRAVFDQYGRDDVETLDRLGLLVAPPARPPHVPVRRRRDVSVLLQHALTR
ncbi:MAG: hypothetical protein ACRDPB_03940 [Nocardioidaceae bacterium]